MFLALNDQQLMLQEAAARMAADRATVRPEDLPEASGGLWQDLVDTEFLSLGLPEDVGGAGGGLVEICMVVEAAAYWGLTTAHLSDIVQGASLLARCAPDVATDKLADIAGGALRLALGHAEASDVNPASPTTTATETAGGWKLQGRKVLAFGADAASHLLVTATTPAGLGLFLLPADQAGVTRQSYQTQRGEGAADLLIDCEVPSDSLVADGPQAAAAVNTAFDEAVTVLCWEALGAMRALVDRTAEHLKTREQFGAPLAKLQVLRHRVAEMKVAYEDAKASASLAMIKVSEPGGSRFASGAKAHSAAAARTVATQAVQLHGGMGVTEETLVSTFFLRLTAFELILGSKDYHFRRYADAAMPGNLHWKSAVLS